MNARTAILLTAMILAILPVRALAVEPDEILEDPALEARARDLSRELRCITCQSQSIDDSDAPLAKDLRLIVRERLLAGDTDQEIMIYMTDRYGDYVLLKPVLRGDTALLWFAPLIALGGALGAAFIYFRQIRKNSPGDDSNTNHQYSEDPSKEEPYTDDQYKETQKTEENGIDKRFEGDKNATDPRRPK